MDIVNCIGKIGFSRFFIDLTTDFVQILFNFGVLKIIQQRFQVGWAFLKILPAYPFLAVLISFVFLFVIDLWEHVFHLPLEWLNNPIYYGTLYGPFAYTYVHVKREVLRRNHYDWKTEYGSRSVPTDAFV